MSARPTVATAAVMALATLVAACSPPDQSPSPSATPSSVAAVAPPSPTPSPAGDVYVALGDSVTFGIGAEQRERDGYVALLADRLRAAEPSISTSESVAVPGETAVGFRQRHLDEVVAAIERLGPRVGLVTIGLGGNDLLRVRRDPACRDDIEAPSCAAAAAAAVDDASAALDAIVEEVQRALNEAGSDARILLLAYYNPDVGPMAARTVAGTDGVVACDAREMEPGLNDRIACVAESRGVGLVDLYAAFLGREEELTGIARGDVHPNAAGHRVIADEIAATLGLP